MKKAAPRPSLALYRLAALCWIGMRATQPELNAETTALKSPLAQARAERQAAYEACVEALDREYATGGVRLALAVSTHRAWLKATLDDPPGEQDLPQRLRLQLASAKKLDDLRQSRYRAGAGGVCDMPLTRVLSSEIEIHVLKQTNGPAHDLERLQRQRMDALQERQALAKLWHQAGEGSFADFADASSDLLLSTLEQTEATSERIALLGQLRYVAQQPLLPEKGRDRTASLEVLLGSTALDIEYQMRILREGNEAAPAANLPTLQHRRIDALTRLVAILETQLWSDSLGYLALFDSQKHLLRALCDGLGTHQDTGMFLESLLNAARKQEADLRTACQAGNRPEWEGCLARVLAAEIKVALLRVPHSPASPEATAPPQPALVPSPASLAVKPTRPPPASNAEPASAAQKSRTSTLPRPQARSQRQEQRESLRKKRRD